MKYLLTGSKGQLGYAFKSIFKGEKDIVLYSFGKEELDITGLEQVRKTIEEIQPDAILNCAAYNAVDKAEEDWEKAYLVNGIGPRNLAIVCNELDIPLVHYSTDYVFDGKKGSPYTIADEPNPINEYGKSKLLGERFVQSLCNKYLLIRTSWVFGPGGKPGSNFVDKVLSWAEKNDHLKIVDDQISSPTYTFDLADATLDLLKQRAWGLYHITNSGNCSRYEWAKYILECIGWKGTLDTAKSSDFETKAERPGLSAISNYPLSEMFMNIPDWQDSTKKTCKHKTEVNLCLPF
jgi:dTDP-4-dehydrorhamnose reductase